jgi:hypothetical protein
LWISTNLDSEKWAEIINDSFEHIIYQIYRYEGMVARLMAIGCWPSSVHPLPMKKILSAPFWPG